MAILRSNKPPVQADIDDFVWKKWFQDIGDLTKAGVVSPSPLSYSTNGVQGHYVPKSILINGDFSVWQRGTSFATGAANVYAADRWQVGRGAVAGMTASRQTGPSGFPYCIRLQRDAGNTNTNDIAMSQNIPSSDSSRFAGQTITLSLWARVGANFSSGAVFSMRLFSGTGTDESLFSGVTGRVTLGEYRVTPTTNWQRYTFSVAVPTTANQLFCSLAARSMPAVASGAADYVEIAGVQLEAGSEATPFQFEPFADTYLKCRRYYQKSFPYAVVPAQNTLNNLGAFQHVVTTAGAAVSYSGVLSFSPTMARTPTITFYNPQAANAFTWNYNTTTSGTATTTTGILNEKYLAIQTTGVAAWAVGQLLGIHWSAEAEF